MHFNNDEEVKAYVNSQLVQICALPNGPFFASLRPQWRYNHLPSNEMDIGHLEWKIYRKVYLGRLGGDVPSSEVIDEMGGLFGYWALRITSDYRFFFFVHSNSSAGPWTINNLFEHGSLLCISSLTNDGENALHHCVEHILSNRQENQYYIS